VGKDSSSDRVALDTSLRHYSVCGKEKGKTDRIEEQRSGKEKMKGKRKDDKERMKSRRKRKLMRET
jgi:hypothetical protein